MKVLLDRLSTSWFIKKRMEKEERRHMYKVIMSVLMAKYNIFFERWICTNFHLRWPFTSWMTSHLSWPITWVWPLWNREDPWRGLRTSTLHEMFLRSLNPLPSHLVMSRIREMVMICFYINLLQFYWINLPYCLF